MEKKPQTWEQQVEEEEAGHVMSHPDRCWDLSLQSMTHQIPSHSCFGAWTHLTFHKQWKKGRCTVQTRFYRCVNSSVGPSIQQEMFALDLRSFSSARADSTHHQFHHKAPVCFGVDTARCRNAMSSCCISQPASSGQALAASVRSQGEGMGRRGWLQGREHKELPPIHSLPMWKGVSQIGHSLKLYMAEFRKPSLTRTIAKGGKNQQNRFLLSLLGGHNHQGWRRSVISQIPIQPLREQLIMIVPTALPSFPYLITENQRRKNMTKY